MTPVAHRLAALLTRCLQKPLPLRLRAWDGSEAGPTDAPVVVLRSRPALPRLLWQPGELGLAQAYIAGEIDMGGDVAEGLSAVWRQARDRGAISHHYDRSNDFNTLLLDDSMAYSCGYWKRPDDPAYQPADAQQDKLDLICRKLGLAGGTRLLDVGCGWGSLSLHAAREYKAQVTAVTLSREQRDFVVERVRQRGLADLVEVELRHYRDIEGGGYDAVSAIERGEHVGEPEYPAFAARLHGLLRPRGRLLVQQMSRESLREHYTRTIAAWHRTLEERWDDFVALVGQPTARVRRLYLVGSGPAFAERRMGVDQILAVRPTRTGDAGMPGTPHGWYGGAFR
ncbi:class I SAM-dependent methyltransferase [Streptomyces flavidovirens]